MTDIERKTLELTQEAILTWNRYSDFTVCDPPVPFNELFDKQDIDFVQVHLMVPTPDLPGVKNSSRPAGEPIGLVGQFGWQDNKLISLDHDTYSESMLVYAWNTVRDKVYRVIDICVGYDWQG